MSTRASQLRFARVLSCLLLVACLHRAPSPSAALAPHTHTVEQLRAAMPVGTEMKLRVEQAGQPPAIQRWTVTAADAVSCTIASQVLGQDGTVLADEGEGTSSWVELYAHADFPADRTTVSDELLDTPLGRLATRRYEVVEVGEDGQPVRKVMHFAVDLPGPPVQMTVFSADGTVRMKLTQIERSPRPGP